MSLSELLLVGFMTISITKAYALEVDLANIHNQLSSIARRDSKIEGNIGDHMQQVRGYFNISKIYQPGSICEIGFNAGHSASTFLFASPKASYLGFDLGNQADKIGGESVFTGSHLYTEQCFSKIKELFPQNVKRLIIGDSNETVPSFSLKSKGKFRCDLIHVDGGHYGTIPLDDIINMAKLARPAGSTHLLVDDSVCLVNLRIGCYMPQRAWIVATMAGMVSTIKCISFTNTRGYCLGKYNRGAVSKAAVAREIWTILGLQVSNKTAALATAPLGILSQKIIVSRYSDFDSKVEHLHLKYYYELELHRRKATAHRRSTLATSNSML